MALSHSDSIDLLSEREKRSSKALRSHKQFIFRETRELKWKQMWGPMISGCRCIQAAPIFFTTFLTFPTLIFLAHSRHSAGGLGTRSPRSGAAE